MYRRVVLPMLLCLLGLPAPVAATVVLPVSDQALAEHATAIVIGRVVSMQGLYEPQQQKVVTDVRVALDEVLAGDLPLAEITLRQLGGVAGTLLSQVYGSPEFVIGEKVLLFLRQRPDGSLRVAHLYQGKFSIHTDPTSGEEYVFRSVPSGVALWRRPDEGEAAPAQRDDSHWLRDFRDRIRAFIPEDRRRPLEGDGGGHAGVAPETSSGPIEVRAEFTYLVPSAPARWFEPDSGTAVTVRINEAGEPLAPTGGVDQVRQALQAWSTVSGSTFRFQDGGDTSAAGFRRDDVNAVSFGDPDGDMDAPVNCGGTLAIGGYWATSGQRTINGQVFTRIVEGDVVFADGWAGCGFYETFANLAEVATHELGHTLGLGHATNTTATMYAYAHFDGRGASLRDDDKNGLRFIYPPFTLTVSKSGNDSGTVTSNPAAIDCGGTCSADFSYNATVTLTATPAAGSTFEGWSGACAGTGPCTLSMTQARNVTATFATQPLTLASVTASPAGTQSVGTPLTLTATATGGAAPYQYKWWLWNGNAWSLLQDWTPSPTYTWTSANAGSYYLGVWVKNGNAVGDVGVASGALPVTIAPATVSLAASPGGTQSVGTPITATVTATGVTSPTYRFWLWDGSTWSLLQDWTPSPTHTWTPTAAGSYYLGVWVKPSSAAGDVPAASGALPVTIAPATVSLAASPGGAQAVGTPITATATATGVTSPTYRFWLWDGSTWSMIRDWGSNTVTWTPSTAGNYYLGVWVKPSSAAGDVSAAAGALPVTVR